MKEAHKNRNKLQTTINLLKVIILLIPLDYFFNATTINSNYIKHNQFHIE